MMSF